MGRNTEAVERFWTAFEAGDIDAALDIFAGDAVMHDPAMPPLRGREQLRPMLEGWRRAFPDVRHELVDLVESGDTVAVRLRVTGTHTGPMKMPGRGDIPPTGREFVWDSVDWIKLHDGKVTHWLAYTDNVPFLAGLGLIPDPAQAHAG